jgi:hypothetical protein
MTLTVVGHSPLEGRPDHALSAGDQAVVFARQTELVWRDGSRSIFQLLGVPSDAYYIVGDDGLYHGRWDEGPVSLVELLDRIARRREIIGGVIAPNPLNQYNRTIPVQTCPKWRCT